MDIKDKINEALDIMEGQRICLFDKVEQTDNIAYFRIQHEAKGLKVIYGSSNVEKVTQLPLNVFVGRYLHEINKEDTSDPDVLIKALEERPLTKRISIAASDYLVVIWKESDRVYGEYLIRL